MFTNCGLWHQFCLHFTTLHDSVALRHCRTSSPRTFAVPGRSLPTNITRVLRFCVLMCCCHASMSPADLGWNHVGCGTPMSFFAHGLRSMRSFVTCCVSCISSRRLPHTVSLPGRRRKSQEILPRAIAWSTPPRRFHDGCCSSHSSSCKLSSSCFLTSCWSVAKFQRMTSRPA